MEPFEEDELSDRELDALLPAWQSPAAPRRLRAAIFPAGPKPWWRAMWSTSVRIPVPLACCLAIALALLMWRGVHPVIRTERVPVPVVQKEVVTNTVYRDRVVREPAAPARPDMHELRPVAELRPRIIRRGNDQN
jgi:hypothetical protein